MCINFNYFNKKYAFIHFPLIFRYTSVVIPFQVRFRSVPKNRRKMGLTRDLQGNYLGLAAKASWNASAFNSKKKITLTLHSTPEAI